MKNGMTALFNESEINRWFDRFEEKAEDKLKKLLQAAGETFVKYARESGKYYDHTGNLRSSVGYVIAIDGDTVYDNFQKSSKGTDKMTGENESEKLANELIASHNKGMVLIAVAGMQYAVYVEAMEGKDVIAGASIRTEDWLRKQKDVIFSKM